jgi:glycogen synthase
MENENRLIPIINNFTVETGKLPETMGPMSEFIDYKQGGVGDVVPMICETLADANCDVRVTVPNYKAMFPQPGEEEEQLAVKHHISHGKVHLVDSEHFDKLISPYQGDKPFQGVTAAAYQANAAKIVKTIRSTNEGQMIPIVHDWMPAGYLTSYFKARNIPYLMVVHSIHTGYIDMNIFSNATGGRFDRRIGEDVKSNFYLHPDNENLINCLADGIKNAELVGIVGKSILEELVNDKHDMDWDARNELKVKNDHGQVVVLPNALMPRQLPENQSDILRKIDGVEFGPNTKYFLEKKMKTQLGFQRATGLNIGNQYITLTWPSRVDKWQKGIDLLEANLYKLLENNLDVQIAVMGDDTDKEQRYKNFFVGAAIDKEPGRVCYYGYRGNEELSDASYAASNIIISAPRFEPFGIFVPQALAAGTFVMSNKTGGPKDMITEYNMDTGEGNGFLMNAHTADEFYKTVQRAIDSVRYLKNNPLRYSEDARAMMVNARIDHSPEAFGERYISALERINKGPVR